MIQKQNKTKQNKTKTKQKKTIPELKKTVFRVQSCSLDVNESNKLYLSAEP